MNPAEFAKKWGDSTLKERSGYQEHFIDLCRLVGHPTPAEIDPTGASFCFERGAAKVEGGQGWADAWKRGHFGWEYKGKAKDLATAYQQLLQYREALENPPLLVVCDFDRIVVHTNFTNTPSEIYDVSLADIKTARGLDLLRSIFHEPEKLRPGITSQAITAEAAKKVAQIARRLRDRGEEPHAVARFLDRLVFCLFAEDIELLPKDLFRKIIEKCAHDPGRLQKLLSELFGAMATGGDFGMDEIHHFNGSLFDGAEVLELDGDDIAVLAAAAKLEWDAVDPSIFGTLFERGLDPDKRSQLGAHYTSREDIVALVKPVLMEPLEREWIEVRKKAEEALEKVANTYGSSGRKLSDTRAKKHQTNATQIVSRFLGRLTKVKILDPACGSGNFLYVGFQLMKDFEKEVILWAMDKGLEAPVPLIHPKQLYGIEINPYAHDLAQMTIWIGHLQWIRANGFGSPPEPILQPLRDNFLNVDAILVEHLDGSFSEPEWPAADVIVGNPPFLGGKLLRSNLGDRYVDQIFEVWKGRVPAEADLCCYWFEKARAQIETEKCRRAGLLATQGIRGGANRRILKRIKETGDIFFAISDRPWILDGANVHISMVGFDGGPGTERILDGEIVGRINANLTSAADITEARVLAENAGVSFMGDTKGGAFDISEDMAVEMLALPNPHGKPNSDVLAPWVNGKDLTQRSRGMWIIDYGDSRTEAEAARYEAPFRYVAEKVTPERQVNQREIYRSSPWQHLRSRPEMRQAIAGLPRFLATPRVAKYRLFIWMATPTVPDSALIAFSRSDDYFSGVLNSRLHEVWSRAQATQLREESSGTRYTPTTCFETFPFHWPLGTEPAETTYVKAVADAAAALHEMRDRWLNPPEWTTVDHLEFPATADGRWSAYFGTDGGDSETARYPVRRPRDAASAVSLKTRTLTALYNEMPRWLSHLHDDLNSAVVEAYRAATSAAIKSDDDDAIVIEFLLDLNLVRAGGEERSPAW